MSINSRLRLLSPPGPSVRSGTSGEKRPTRPRSRSRSKSPEQPFQPPKKHANVSDEGSKSLTLAKYVKVLPKPNYRCAWENEEKLKTWIAPSKKGSQFAYCKFCNCDLKAKHSDLVDHASVSKHIKAVRNAQCQPTVSAVMQQRASQDTRKQAVCMAELTHAFMTAEHNIAFNASTHLSDLYSRMFPDSKIAKEFKSKRSKTAALIRQVLGPHYHNHIVTLLRSNYFSLMFDESTDQGVQTHAACLVKMWNEQQDEVCEFFLVMERVKSGKAVDLFNLLDTVLSEHGVSWNKCLGWNSDNCNTMMGARNSVTSRIKQKQSNIFLQGCISHLSALIACKAANHIPTVVERLLMDIYSYFHQSSKRLQEYESFQHFTNTEPHKLLKLSQTRWLSLEQCVLRLLEQWPALTSYFNSIPENAKVRSIKAGLTPINKAYFLLTQHGLKEINKLNILFQSEKPLVHVVHRESLNLYRGLLGNVLEVNHIYYF